jgi:hypothetical protein
MEKRKFNSGITLGHDTGMDAQAMRQMAISEPVQFVRKCTALIEDGRINLRNFPWQAAYASLADVKVPVTLEIGGAQRAVMASAFPILTGTTVVKAINDAYLAVPTIGQELVTEIDDNKKITTIAAIHNLDKDIEEVKEHDPFPEIGTDEEAVEIRHRRNGRKLTITAEMIEENEVANIVERVNALGEIASDWIEEQTLKRVIDYDGSAASPAEPYVYRPGGTGTQLYNATANNPGTRASSGTRVNNNAFVDDTDLDAARNVLAAMKNSRGKRISIPWSEVKLLVPNAILGAVSKVFNSEYVPGVENELSNYGPRGRWGLPPERIVSSTKLDDLSPTCWNLGAFQRQFRRKWKLALEYVTLGMDTQAYLDRRIAFQGRIAWDVEVGAVDYVYVVQCLAATTAPKDD